MTFTNTQPQTAVQQQVQSLLSSIVNNLSALFAPDELAFYTLEGKNEMQIRDRVAWRLQNDLDALYPGQYIVRKEWGPDHFNGQKVDLAVLNAGTGKRRVSLTTDVVAMVEFKAHSFLNKEQWPYAEFAIDLNKMSSFAQSVCRQADLYFIFLQSSFDQLILNYPAAVAYPHFFNAAMRTTHPDFLPTMTRYWSKFFLHPVTYPVKASKRYTNQYTIDYAPGSTVVAPAPQPQSVGKAFGYNVVVAPMVWGPYKIK